MKALKIIKNILFGVTLAALILAIALFTLPLFTDIEYRAVQTGSMEPDIPVGSLVVVVPTPAEEIQVGDDVTYVTQSGQVVTHRVLEIDRENNTFVTYGVANGADSRDPELQYDNILGVAKFHIPWIGPAVIYLNTLTGKIVAGTVILSLFILSLLLSVIASGRKQKKAQQVLRVDPAVAGKDYRAFLNVESKGDGPVPLQAEAPAEEKRAPSGIEEPEKPTEDKKTELLFGSNYPDFSRQGERKRKKQKKEATDEFWNGGDGL